MSTGVWLATSYSAIEGCIKDKNRTDFKDIVGRCRIYCCNSIDHFNRHGVMSPGVRGQCTIVY